MRISRFGIYLTVAAMLVMAGLLDELPILIPEEQSGG